MNRLRSTGVPQTVTLSGMYVACLWAAASASSFLVIGKVTVVPTGPAGPRGSTVAGASPRKCSGRNSARQPPSGVAVRDVIVAPRREREYRPIPAGCSSSTVPSQSLRPKLRTASGFRMPFPSSVTVAVILTGSMSTRTWLVPDRRAFW